MENFTAKTFYAFQIVALVVVACAFTTDAQTSPTSALAAASPTEQGTTSNKTRMRTLDELIDKKEPGIVIVRRWIDQAKVQVDLLSVERPAGEKALLALQVTSRSPMGAIALETGGLLLDHGWLRVLGAEIQSYQDPFRCGIIWMTITQACACPERCWLGMTRWADSLRSTASA